MSDPPNGTTQIELDAIIAAAQSKLTIPKLKTVLRSFNLAVSGNKSILVERLLAFVDRLSRDRNTSGIHDVFVEMNKLDVFIAPEHNASTTYTNMVNNLTTEFNLPPQFGVSNSRGFAPVEAYGSPFRSKLNALAVGGATRASTRDGLPIHPPALQFQDHPFYRFSSQLSRPSILASPYTRETCTRTMSFKVTPSDIDALRDRKLMVALVSQRYHAPLAPRPIEFPMHTFIRLDDMTVQANTRGIKNHPGSTPPADLTPLLLANPGNNHRVEITVQINLRDPRKDEHMASKSYGFVVVMLEVRSEEELKAVIMNRPHIGVDVTKEQIKTNQEPDDENDVLISAESVHSLKDPVSYTRMSIPIRSLRCSHIDCFDAAAYIQLQLQASTWKCPICNKIISWESLAIDDYFVDVLNSADADVDQVNVNPDGSWTVRSRDLPDDSDSDDDFPAKKARNDRVEVIDLVSDDEPEPQVQPQAPPPKPKRQQPTGQRIDYNDDYDSSWQSLEEGLRLMQEQNAGRTAPSANISYGNHMLTRSELDSIARSLDEDTDDELPTRIPAKQTAVTTTSEVPHAVVPQQHPYSSPVVPSSSEFQNSPNEASTGPPVMLKIPNIIPSPCPTSYETNADHSATTAPPSLQSARVSPTQIPTLPSTSELIRSIKRSKSETPKIGGSQEVSNGSNNEPHGEQQRPRPVSMLFGHPDSSQPAAPNDAYDKNKKPLDRSFSAPNAPSQHIEVIDLLDD